MTSAGGVGRPAVLTGRRQDRVLGVIRDQADRAATGEACPAGCEAHGILFGHRIVAGRFVICATCGHLVRPMKGCGCAARCHETGPAQVAAAGN